MFAWTSEQSGKIERAGDVVEIEESAFGKRKYNREGLTNDGSSEKYIALQIYFSHILPL